MSAAAATLSPAEEKLRNLRSDPYMPGWFNEQRQRARDAYFDLALPTRSDEAWHYGEPQRYTLDGLDLSHALPGFNGKQYERICGLTGLPRRVACLSMIGPHVADLSQSDALLKAGVTVMALRQALILRGDQLEPFWVSPLICPDCNPLLAGHFALVDNGFFVHIPKGVEAPEAVHLIMEAGEPSSVVAPRVLLVAEAGAKVDVFAHFIGGSTTERSLTLGVIQAYVGEGAQVTLTKVQNIGQKTDAYTHDASDIGKDSTFTSISVNFGGYHLRHESVAELRNPGGTANLYGMHFLTGRQRYDFHTHQNHQAPDTKSSLLFKSALLNRTRASYQGVITVAPKAQRTDAYQANRSLLLSQDARSDSSPQLEIMADDVRCTHGSTTANVSDDEMFYLQSRALPPETARRLLVSGFMAEVADRIPLQAVRDYAYSHVQEMVQ